MALTFAELHKLNNWGIRPRNIVQKCFTMA
jgi:hypothetical protein